MVDAGVVKAETGVLAEYVAIVSELDEHNLNVSSAFWEQCPEQLKLYVGNDDGMQRCGLQNRIVAIIRRRDGDNCLRSRSTEAS